MLIGYARVSTNEQNLDLQRDALLKAGVAAKDIYTDKITGTTAQRPGLEQALSHLIHAAASFASFFAFRGLSINDSTFCRMVWK